MNKKLLCILLIGLIALASSGCTTENNEKGAFGFIPSNSDYVGNVEINTIINDNDFNDIYETWPKSSGDPQTINDAMIEFETESGVDVGKITDVTFFGSLDESMDQYSGYFIIGSFNSNALINKAIENGNFEKARYQGYEYYLETSSFGSSEAIMEMDDGLVLLTTSASVIEDVIDIKKGDKISRSGELMDKYNSLDSGIIKIAFEVPANVKEDIENSNPGPYNFESVNEIEMITYLFQKKSSTMTNTVNVYTADSASAEDIADVVDGFLKIYKGMIPDEKTKETIDKITIEQKGSAVTIKSSSTVQEIEDMSNSFKQMIPH
jgi:hypothetical protein